MLPAKRLESKATNWLLFVLNAVFLQTPESDRESKCRAIVGRA